MRRVPAASLPGPRRVIVVEPIELPQEAPAPREAPDRDVPAPPPREPAPDREPAPA
jgi:hypothetical protein